MNNYYYYYLHIPAASFQIYTCFLFKNRCVFHIFYCKMFYILDFLAALVFFLFFSLAVFIVVHSNTKATSLYVKTCSAINLILITLQDKIQKRN